MVSRNVSLRLIALEPGESSTFGVRGDPFEYSGRGARGYYLVACGCKYEFFSKPA